MGLRHGMVLRKGAGRLRKKWKKISKDGPFLKKNKLYFNKILKSNGFNIINNTKKYKIIRVLYENIIDNRTLINNDIKINNTDNVFLLPDNESFDKISIDQLFTIFTTSNQIFCYHY